jgi:hypothetical protein
MLNEVLCVMVLIVTGLQVCLLGWIVCEFLRLRKFFILFKATLLEQILRFYRSVCMEVDQLIDTLISEEAAAGSCVANRETSQRDTAGEVAQKRERIAAVIAGGQSQRYLGRAISLDQVDKLPDSEIVKLYARYEMVFGASIVKTLGHAVLTMYSDLAAYYRPKINACSLTSDLESNPLVELGLSAYSGSLYHRFGLFLTPIAVALTTIKHCKFGEDEDGRACCTADSSGDATSQEPQQSESRQSIGCE